MREVANEMPCFSRSAALAAGCSRATFLAASASSGVQLSRNTPVTCAGARVHVQVLVECVKSVWRHGVCLTRSPRPTQPASQPASQPPHTHPSPQVHKHPPCPRSRSRRQTCRLQSPQSVRPPRPRSAPRTATTG